MIGADKKISQYPKKAKRLPGPSLSLLKAHKKAHVNYQWTTLWSSVPTRMVNCKISLTPLMVGEKSSARHRLLLRAEHSLLAPHTWALGRCRYRELTEWPFFTRVQHSVCPRQPRCEDVSLLAVLVIVASNLQASTTTLRHGPHQHYLGNTLTLIWFREDLVIVHIMCFVRWWLGVKNLMTPCCDENDPGM